MANYIVFHPESSRQNVNVSGIAKIGDSISHDWIGNVWVDKIGIGNEDPYVFSDIWLYSYCHASQLRRSHQSDPHLKHGSKIIFVSGQDANKGYLTIDTVFYIQSSLPWNKPLQLPTKYEGIYKDLNSDLWKRHFRFPFAGIHGGVTHTYEAISWLNNKEYYSFLPIDKTGHRTSIPLDSLSLRISEKICKKVRGKYPVLLEHSEIDTIIKQIISMTAVQVVKIHSLLPETRK